MLVVRRSRSLSAQLLRRWPWRAALLVVFGCLAACGSSGSSPDDVVQSYVTALGQGNYATACSMIGRQGRRQLAKTTHARVSCTKIFARCLPDEATKPKTDQSQLLYASLDTNIVGDQAHVAVSRTPVARALKKLTLVERKGQWHLTSYGEALSDCHLRHR